MAGSRGASDYARFGMTSPKSVRGGIQCDEGPVDPASSGKILGSGVTNTVIVALWAGHDLPGYSRNKFLPADVRNLWEGVKRHITGPRLIVLCDTTHAKGVFAELGKEIEIWPLKGWGIGGWTPMLETFQGDIHFERDPLERALLVGLDTVFVANSDWLFEWDRAPVGLPCDPSHPFQKPPCNAVVSFDAAGADLLWREFLSARKVMPYPYMYAGVPGEMTLMQAVWRRHRWPLIDGPPMTRLVSYKCGHVGQNGIPPECSIVYFHGNPKPRDLPTNDPVRQAIDYPWQS